MHGNPGVVVGASSSTRFCVCYWRPNPRVVVKSGEDNREPILGELGPAAPAARLGTEWCEAEYA